MIRPAARNKNKNNSGKDKTKKRQIQKIKCQRNVINQSKKHRITREVIQKNKTNKT